jgi:hypothetical protein
MRHDVTIIYREDMPKQLVRDLVQELRGENVNVQVEERENVPYAAFEWAIPAAVILFIAKAYVDTLLKEAAKDHYPIIKRKLAKFADKVLRIKQQVFVSAQSPNKVNKNNPVSNSFAVWAMMIDGRPLRFLFYGDREEDYYEYAIEKIFNILMNHASEYPNDELSIQVLKAPGLSREIYLLFDESTREWKVADMRTGTFIGG